jgi:phosphoribosyl-ATP pyrophosphohydrolase
MRRLDGLVGGFLVTFVEREGRMGGTRLERVPELVAAAGGARVTIAGGITTADDIAKLDAMGADAQVGMALYTGWLGLAEAIAGPLKSDRPDGLWPTVIVDELGVALGLAWSDLESLREAIRLRGGVYKSRSRGLWIKGETSGDGQELLRVDLDCDRDALRFVVRQNGRGFCHNGTRTCWGSAGGLMALPSRISKGRSSDGSYTERLLGDPGLLASKLKEEAGELAGAVTREDVVCEAADVLYFTCVAMERAGVSLADVSEQLAKRALRVTRRPGNAKAEVAS